MSDYNEQTLMEAVIKSVAATPDPRLRQIMNSLVKHLHGFVREIRPTWEEWLAGIQFLTAVGQKCDDKRQEFILLSDSLGVSMLVDLINHGKVGIPPCRSVSKPRARARCCRQARRSASSEPCLAFRLPRSDGSGPGLRSASRCSAALIGEAAPTFKPG